MFGGLAWNRFADLVSTASFAFVKIVSDIFMEKNGRGEGCETCRDCRIEGVAEDEQKLQAFSLTKRKCCVE